MNGVVACKYVPAHFISATAAFVKLATYCFVPATEEDNCTVVETFGYHPSTVDL